jgi:hypothetical protein
MYDAETLLDIHARAHESLRRLSLVQCRVGLSWQNEAVHWHCPGGVALVPVVEMKVRIPFNLIWKKDNSSPLLQKFIGQVRALIRS